MSSHLDHPVLAAAFETHLNRDNLYGTAPLHKTVARNGRAHDLLCFEDSNPSFPI